MPGKPPYFHHFAIAEASFSPILTLLFSDVLLLIVNKAVPSEWLKSPGSAVEVWKESQLLFDTWKLRDAERETEQILESTLEGGCCDTNDEDDESSVLLVDLVEVALSLMREVTSLGKQVAQFSRGPHRAE